MDSNVSLLDVTLRNIMDSFHYLPQKRTIALQTPAKTGAAAIGRDSDPSAHARRASVASPVVTVSTGFYLKTHRSQPCLSRPGCCFLTESKQ